MTSRRKTEKNEPNYLHTTTWIALWSLLIWKHLLDSLAVILKLQRVKCYTQNPFRASNPTTLLLPFGADGEESFGRAGGEGQRREDEDQPVHPSAAREGGGQETGGAAHLPGA